MINNRITLKQIEALVYVADLGTFRKAAAALRTTQPNISVRISTLEKTLDVVLMQRDAGSIKLTEKGKDLLSAARQLLRSAENLLDVADRKDLVEDKLRLGVAEMVAATWLQPFLRAFKDLYPSIRIDLQVDLSHEIENLLSSGEIDLAFLNGPIRKPRFSQVPLGMYRYGWVTSPEIAERIGQKPEFKQMFSEGLMTHNKNTLASKDLRDHIKRAGFSVDELTHVNSLAALLGMAVNGIGIALLPRQLFSTDLNSEKLVELHCEWKPEPLEFFACCNKNRPTLYVEEAAQLAATIAFNTKA